MATQGKVLKDIDSSQMSSVMDITDKAVHAYKSPISIQVNLTLKEDTDKVAAVKNLLSEIDKKSLWGKADFSFVGTKFSSSDIEQIAAEMAKYKDKSINIQFDSKVNNFSHQDTMKILQACDGNKSTLYPFTSASNDGLSSEERQSFLDRNPNIIEGSNSGANLKKLKELLGIKSSNVRSEVVEIANARKIPVSAYATSLVTTMDETKLKIFSCFR